MKKNKVKLVGQDAFEAFYAEVYKDRWPALKKSLYGDSVYIKLSYGQGEDYFLDPGSVCAALCLYTKESKRIVDL